MPEGGLYMKLFSRLIAFSAFLAVSAAAWQPAIASEPPFNGFLEVQAGTRVVSDDAASDDFLLEETRFQMDFLRDSEAASLQFRADFVHDGVAEDDRIDVREANVLLTPVESVDLKLGRQILTWGTGDFLFLNDLFPKDWQSFFIGRDDEYLKKPSDAARLTWYGSKFNVDLAWMPLFESDEFISGERLSYWGGQGKTGPKDVAANPSDPSEPDKTVKNSSGAGRIYWMAGSWEAALYGFRGHYGQPKGFDADVGKPFFPTLEAWGASLRGTLLGGVTNAETSYYRSLEDLDGDDPRLPNSEIRALVGFSREIVSEHNLGLQAYVEHPTDYPAPGHTDHNRWRLTARYTGMFMQQNLILSFFGFYSPSGDDAYLRPKITYKLSDQIVVATGANWFIGAHEDTFFGQFEDNTNVYGRIRYSF